MEGLTSMARATLELLQINSVGRVRLRELLIDAGMFPPVSKR